jgi:hypothetical protein
VPQDGRLVYLETPATIWQAEAVLFDEVSRCRPELQNKLFPLVHEKLAQGLPPPRLKHRWAAMNPPPADGNAFDYEGAEPLGVALADRFPFVLEAPTLDQLKEADRRAVLLGQGRPDPDAARKLQHAVAATKQHLPWAERNLRLPSPLHEARGHPGPQHRGGERRGERPRERGARLEDSFYSAARVSLPDAAWGSPVEGHVLLAAHKAAWEAAKLQKDSPEPALAETDPLQRIALALTLDLPPAEAGTVVADGFAALSRPERLVTSAVLFPRLARTKGSPRPPSKPWPTPTRRWRKAEARPSSSTTAGATGSATSSARSWPNSTRRARATGSCKTSPPS